MAVTAVRSGRGGQRWPSQTQPQEKAESTGHLIGRSPTRAPAFFDSLPSGREKRTVNSNRLNRSALPAYTMICAHGHLFFSVLFVQHRILHKRVLHPHLIPWPRKTPLPTDAAGPACRAARALVGSPPIGRQRLPNRGCATARRTRLPPLPHRSPAWSAEAPSAAPLRGAQRPPAPLPIRIASPTTNVPAAPRSAAPPPGLALLPPSRRSCAIPPSPPPSTFPSSRFVWFPLPFYIGPSSWRQ